MKFVTAIVCCLASVASAADAPPLLRDGATQANDVRLVEADRVAPIVVDAGDAAVVRIAADLLAKDVEAVTGRASSVIAAADAKAADVVIAGTIGQSPTIDRLIADGKLDVSKVRGRWETFTIATVAQPLPNVERGLVIAGNDRRGTAFGIFELSEQIGVSPWYWWADSKPTRREALTIAGGTHVVGPPTVKYRGIFLNDEDWGLTPWAAKTFEPEVGNIGPKTHRKIFELMLRLKSNYFWPAMHPVSTEFARIEENVRAADEWAIVMGASHAEPMNRNNVHWRDEKRGDWRYDTNRDRILAYWREYATGRGKYEAVWTIGMRGIHDSGMPGPKDTKGKVALLAQAIEDQRQLLAENVNANVEQVPQAFMPYKEVLSLYQAGLKLPEDVTLVWCDDNYGYIRQLSNDAEQQRTGRAGVYYHLSYLGRPKPYLWIHTTPPALVWAEMHKALDFGADRIWVANIGDIKPGEILMEFWSRLAWKADRYGDEDPQTAFLTEWATREFGGELAPRIVALLNNYYQLAAQRKPELMEPNLFRDEPYRESFNRLAESGTVLTEADAIAASLPEDKQAAFVEMVGYPARVLGLVNQIYLCTDLAKAKPEDAESYLNTADEARRRLERETRDYNETLAGGKWRGMMQFTGFARTGEYTNWSADWFMSLPKPSTRPSNFDRRAGVARDIGNTTRLDHPPKIVEVDRVVSFEAEDFTRVRPGESAKWLAIPGLGRTGRGAVTPRPTNVPSVDDPAQIAAKSPMLEYEFETTTPLAKATLHLFCLPTYRVHAGRGMRYAIAVDDATPQVIEFGIDPNQTGEHDRAFLDRARRNLAITTSVHDFSTPGRHTLRIWMVDPGMVADKVVIDLGGMKPSELGPPPTLAVTPAVPGGR